MFAVQYEQITQADFDIVGVGHTLKQRWGGRGNKMSWHLTEQGAY